MIRILIALLATICLLGCTPEGRLARLVKRHPELIKTDTIWKKDTVVVAGTQKDTSFYFYQKDTVVIKQDQLTMKYFFRSDSTIYLEGKCDTVTIIREIPVQVNTITPVEQIPWWERWLPWIVLGACAIAFILPRLRRPPRPI